MLILSRKLKESIIIDDEIEITIVQVEGDCVKLAIKAPKEVSILRKEMYDVVKEANELSASKSRGEKLSDELLRVARNVTAKSKGQNE